MFKKSIAFFFSILFVVFLAAPSIIIAIDNNADISLFYSLGEEEEKESFSSKLKEVLFFETSIKQIDCITFYDVKNNIKYFYKKYPKPHLNLISPPPEAHIL